MKNILKSICIVAAFAISIGSAAAQNLKIATVDMQKLFNEYHLTQTTQEKVKVDQARIQQENGERLKKIRDLQSKIENLSKQKQDPTVSDKKRVELEREIQMRVSEGNAADNERRQWLARRNKALNENIVAEMRSILGEIREKVEAHARENDFDLVLDKSARSANQVETFVFVKDKFDITAQLLETLNKNAPAKPAEGDKAGE
ncbi:hypothetical protein Rhal01_01144 [Rubritalea halochordaticola]|uniref:OmpH family outer membrane protein n=1 Tax=Rubritalea halochordaticola TaxID=714537 RepID=A0ABP9UZ10_9BACT